MGTTTKMAIPYPEATGLVKDGWEDMKDIATQVDAKSGLVLLNTTSFSAVSSVSLANNTFSSNFDNYRIVMNHDTSGANAVFYMRMRASGTDNTSANYAFSSSAVNQAGSFTGNTSGSTNLETSFNLITISGTYSSTTVMDIFLPFSSTYQTNYVAHCFYFESLSNFRAGFSSGSTSVTTSYDSATLYVASGTMTGSYSVYGYNK